MINCMRVRKLCEDKNISVESLKDKFVMHSHHTDGRLNAILHNFYTEDEFPDAFVYEIARELNVSCDYLYGLVDEPMEFIPIKGDPYEEFKWIKDLVLKYCREENIEKRNTNILAYRTGLDRQVFDILFNDKQDAGWWMISSYYVISRLAHTFDANFHTMILYTLNGEEDEEMNRFCVNLSNKYEEEFHDKTI